MANEEKISEYVDRAGVSGDTKFILDHLNEVLGAFQKLGSIRVGLNGVDQLGKIIPATKEASATVDKFAESQVRLAATSRQVAEANKIQSAGYKELFELAAKNDIAQKELTKSKKALTDAYQAGTITEKQYIKELTENKETQIALSVSQQAVTKALKDQEKAFTAISGSIEEARSKVTQLTSLRNKIDLTTPEGLARVKELNKEIDKQNDFIRENNDQLGKQKINIGNYQGSAKIIVDAMERARVKVKEVSDQFGKASPEAKAARMEFETLDRITTNPQFLNISAKVGDTNKELRFFTQRLNEMEDAGLKNTTTYRELQRRLAQLTDQLGDTRAEIKALSSDSRGFDLFAGSVNFAADAFQTLAGAAVLAGASEEDAAAATKTLVAIQSVANGVKGIATELTTKGTAANKAYTYVLKGMESAFGAGSTAAQRFSGILKSIGIVAAIGIILELIKRFKDTGDAAEQAAKDVEKLNIQLSRNKQIVDSLAKSDEFDFKGNVESLKQYYAEKVKGAKDDTEVQAIETEKKKALFDEEIKFRTDRLEKIRVQSRNATSDYQKELAEQNKFYAGQEALRKATGKGDIDPKLKEQLDQKLALLKDNEKAVKAQLVDEQKNLIAFRNSANTAQVESEADLAQKLRQQQNEDAEKSRQEAERIAKANQQAEYEIRRIELQRAADFSQEIVDNERASQEDRLLQLFYYIQRKKDLIDLEESNELSASDLTAKQRELIEVKKRDAIIRLSEETAKTVAKIREKDFSTGTDKLAATVTGLTPGIAAQLQQIKEEEDKVRAAQLEADKQYAEQKRQLYVQLYQQINDTITSFLTNGIEKQKNRLQEEMDQLDEKKAKDIEVANQTIANAEERDAQISIIEKRAAARKQVLENEQRKLDVQRAKIEKSASLIRIAVDTVTKVFQIKAQAALLAANPLTAPYAAVALAQIPFVIAGGALAAAAIAATPIPKYKMGTKDHPGGLAEVGHGKAELVQNPDGSMFVTPSTPTILDLQPHAIVHPDAELAMKMAFANTSVPSMSNNSPVNLNLESMNKGIARMEKSIVSAIKSKTETHIRVEDPIKSWVHKSGDTFTEYLNRSI